jgi:hypothetical protein
MGYTVPNIIIGIRDSKDTRKAKGPFIFKYLSRTFTDSFAYTFLK